MRHLHCYRRAVDQQDLVAPVELVGFSGCEAQRNIRIRRRRYTIALPATAVAPDGIIPTLIAAAAQFLENPDQRQPLAPRLALVEAEQPIEI